MKKVLVIIGTWKISEHSTNTLSGPIAVFNNMFLATEFKKEYEQANKEVLNLFGDYTESNLHIVKPELRPVIKHAKDFISSDIEETDEDDLRITGDKINPTLKERYPKLSMVLDIVSK